MLKNIMAVALHFETLGKGRPVMILHGLFGSARNWQGIARQLGKRYQLMLVDLRNHGNSPHHDLSGYVEMAEDIKELSRSLKLEQFSLIGHSMGGKVAMLFALHYPDLIDKLIVMDIAPVNYVRGFDVLIDTMLAMPLASIENRRHADSMMAKNISAPEVRTFLLQNLVRKNNRYTWRINLRALQAGLKEMSNFPEQGSDRQYHGDTLFLGGEESNYLLPEHHHDIYTLFPHAAIHTIPGAGHWLHADQPKLVIEAMQQFIGA